MTRRSLLVAALVAGFTQVAAAQEAPPFRPGHLEVAGGLTLAGGYPVGDLTATLRPNGSGATSPFTLFTADSEIERRAGVDVRAAVGITRAFAIEVGGTYATPRLGITIAHDAEAGETADVGERLSQYSVDVSALYALRRIRLGPRAQVYVLGGAGYLRQLHEDRLLVETGRTLHGGGGLRYWMRGGVGPRRPFGVRAEARLVRRSGGIDFADQARTFPVFSVLGFVGF